MRCPPITAGQQHDRLDQRWAKCTMRDNVGYRVGRHLGWAYRQCKIRARFSLNLTLNDVSTLNSTKAWIAGACKADGRVSHSDVHQGSMNVIRSYRGGGLVGLHAEFSQQAQGCGMGNGTPLRGRSELDCRDTRRWPCIMQ